MLLCDIGISDDYERKIQRVNEEVTADQVQSMYLFVIALNIQIIPQTDLFADF